MAPTSTLENWMRELKMWCPKLRAVKYAGTEGERWELQEELTKGEHVGVNVIVTAFTTFGKESDKGRRESMFLQKKLGRNGRNGKLSYLVIDEAQQIKNADSARNKHLSAVACEHRLLLTGAARGETGREFTAAATTVTIVTWREVTAAAAAATATASCEEISDCDG